MEEDEIKIDENAVIDNIASLDKDDKSEVWNSRGKMSWVALWGMILPTIYIITMITNVDLIDKLGVLMSWYYLSLASIVGAYFGFKSWSQIKGK